jgi:hypothetical protein
MKVKLNSSPGDHVDVTVEFRPGLYSAEWNPPGDEKRRREFRFVPLNNSDLQGLVV